MLSDANGVTKRKILAGQPLYKREGQNEVERE